MRAPTASQRAAPVGTGCSSHARGAAAPKSAELGARGDVENSRHGARIVSAEVPPVPSVLTSDWQRAHPRSDERPVQHGTVRMRVQ